MKAEERLESEARAGKLAAGAAIASVFFTLAVPAVAATTIGDRGEGSRGALLSASESIGGLTAVRAVQALSFLFAALALIYLLRCTLARRPEVPKLVVPVVYLAPLLFAVGAALNLVEVADIADRFTSSGARTEDRAEDLTRGASQVGNALSLAGAFCFAVSFVLVSLNAMRAGLLSQFMGILGVITGALLVLPIPGLAQTQFIVQSFWMGALAVLFLDRWPKGRGPAWSVVEAIPWPSARDLARSEQAGAIPADDPTIEPAADPSTGPDEPVGDSSDPRGEPHPASKKRKRKRRN